MIDEKMKKQIMSAYQQGKGSIQTIARAYGVSVEQVLDVIGEQKSGRVVVQGDMIDASEVGLGAQINPGREYKIPFDLS